MYEELKEEAIVRKVGGRFKLSTLIQKRLVQLNRGGRPFIDTKLTDKMAIVLQEIEQGKIFLDTSNQVRATSSPDFIDTPELDLDDL
ncbi:MAG: DNA-directed RNA polymerase subunit omega [Pirellulaceae bacterium]|jgi:DNA-directed RNA polymerase subunit omega|nr:DNA-directed RNA polymerase subunit omega [Pirellulaceae bacterium]